jgi:hypothetical protein
MAVPRRLIVAVAALAVATGLSACGDDDFVRDPRPPSPLGFAAVITDTGVTVSPTQAGAGLARFTIANQSSEPGALVLEGPSDVASSEILPGNTGRLTTELLEGDYIVSAGEESTVADADLSVGPLRPSAQNELLQP